VVNLPSQRASKRFKPPTTTLHSTADAVVTNTTPPLFSSSSDAPPYSICEAIFLATVAEQLTVVNMPIKLQVPTQPLLLL
jgi:hypothetical protein